MANRTAQAGPGGGNRSQRAMNASPDVPAVAARGVAPPGTKRPPPAAPPGNETALRPPRQTPLDRSGKNAGRRGEGDRLTGHESPATDVRTGERDRDAPTAQDLDGSIGKDRHGPCRRDGVVPWIDDRGHRTSRRFDLRARVRNDGIARDDR